MRRIRLDTLSVVDIGLTGPYLIMEQLLGIGLDIKLSSKLYFYQAAGYGMAIISIPINYSGIKNICEYEWIYDLRFGLKYKF